MCVPVFMMMEAVVVAKRRLTDALVKEIVLLSIGYRQIDR